METIKRKSLLYKSRVPGADYCLNHVEGCSHGCRFPCYAMLMKKSYGAIKDYNDWIKPKIVANALELLEAEIPRLKHKIKEVHLCFSTDPFMYKQPEISDLTLKILERLNGDDIKCAVLTKGVYPGELVDTGKYGRNNEYGITLVSLDDEFRERFEPGAAPYGARVDALKRLHDRGLATWAIVEPYPTPNLVKQDLSKILEKINFVDRIIFGKLNYNPVVTAYPDNKEFYQECADTVIGFCGKHGIDCHLKPQ